jgi:hypothetical protein
MRRLTRIVQDLQEISPMPALEVIWISPSYFQEQVHRETLWQTACSLCLERTLK